MKKYKKYISRFLAVLAAAMIMAASVQTPASLAEEQEAVTEETVTGEDSTEVLPGETETSTEEAITSETAPAEETKAAEETEVTEESTSPEGVAAPEEPTSAESETKAEEATTEEESTSEPEGDEEKDIYATDTVGLDVLRMLDFSSMRLMVGTSDEGIFVDWDVVVSSYNGVYLLQFDDVATAKKAYMYYYDKADFVEVDAGMSIAEGEAAENVSTDTFMTSDDNPLDAIAENGYVGSYDIALIDTGANGADASVSMIGDGTGDDNGHGSSMLGYIAEQAPKARVLSIKALRSDGRGDISAVYAAIEYAISQNVRIINLSMSALAFKDSTVIEDAVNRAVSGGIVVVGAAGNNGRDARYYIPGNIGSAIIAGAASGTGVRLAKSNFGSTVDYNVVANSTSEAAARLSGFIAAKGVGGIAGELNNGLIFATDYEPEGDVNDDTEYIRAYGNTSLIGEGALYALGVARSTITLADRSIGSIDALWADNDGDGMFDNVTAFNSTTSDYVVMYGTDQAEYFAARVVDADRYPAGDFAEMIAAHDNDNGESLSGVIYDPATGIAYIPVSLIDFSGDSYRINQIRIQTLYHTEATPAGGTIVAADGTPYSYNEIDTGYGIYRVDKVPTVGAYTVISDADLSYATGPYGGFYYDSDNRTYVATPGWTPSNTADTGIAENILQSVISNISDLTFYHASNNGYFDSTSWEITLKSGTYTLSDGTSITIKGGTYDLTCNHIGINTNFVVDSTYSGEPHGNFDYDAYYAGVYFKILYRDNDYLYIGLVTASASTQAGAGIIKVAYETTSPADITFTIESERKSGNVTVQKVLKSGSTLDPDRLYSFNYWVSSTNGNWGTPIPFTLTAQQSKTFSVPAGYYWKVEETDYSIENIQTRVTTNGGTSWTLGRTITGQMNTNTTDSFPIWFATSSPNKTVSAVRSEGGSYTLTHNTTVNLPAGTYTVNEGVSLDRRYRLMPGDVVGWTHKCYDNVDIWEGQETILATTEAGKSAYIGTIRYTYTPSNHGASGEYKFENGQDNGNLSITKSVTEEKASLTVKKEVKNCYNDNQKFNMRLTITKPDGSAETRYTGAHNGVTFTNGVATFQLGKDETKTFTGIPVGDKYSITEVNMPAGYVAETSLPVTGTLGSTAQYDGSFDFRVTLYTDANMTSVATNVTGTYGDVTFNAGIGTFSMRTGTKNITSLPAGLYYKVEETNNHGYTSSISNATGSITAGATASVTASNSLGGSSDSKTIVNKAFLDPVGILLTKVDENGTDSDRKLYGC